MRTNEGQTVFRHRQLEVWQSAMALAKAVHGMLGNFPKEERFALYPQINISVHEIWGKNKRNIVFAVGKSIFNKTSKMNIGEFMLQYGGGGHIAAGTCQVPINQAAKIRKEIITAMVQDV